MKKIGNFRNAGGDNIEIVFRKPNKKIFGEDCDGYCTGRRVVINPYRSDQVILNTIVHEMAHAFFWDKTEKEITSFGNAVSKILYTKMKYRKNNSSLSSKG